MFSSWCSPFVLAFLWDVLPLFVLLTFCFDLVLAVDKKMEYICIELSVYYGHLFFLVICVSIHNTTSMQTSFESMFMLPQITAHLPHEHPCAPVEMTSYRCQLLCAHISIDDLGFYKHQGKNARLSSDTVVVVKASSCRVSLPREVLPWFPVRPLFSPSFSVPLIYE